MAPQQLLPGGLRAAAIRALRRGIQDCALPQAAQRIRRQGLPRVLLGDQHPCATNCSKFGFLTWHQLQLQICFLLFDAIFYTELHVFSFDLFVRAEAFKHNTERLVNDLTRSSKSAEEKLEVIEERSDQIIKESSQVKDTLSSIEMQADKLVETSKHVDEQINDVLIHSKTIFEQSKEIATTQKELSKGQRSSGRRLRPVWRALRNHMKDWETGWIS